MVWVIDPRRGVFVESWDVVRGLPTSHGFRVLAALGACAKD